MLYIGDNKIIKGYIGDIPVTHVSFGNRALIKLEVFVEKRFTPKCTDFSVDPRSTIIIEYTSEGISKNDITVTYDESFFTRNGDSFTLIAEGYSEIIYSVKGLSSVIIRVATSMLKTDMSAILDYTSSSLPEYPSHIAPSYSNFEIRTEHVTASNKSETALWSPNNTSSDVLYVDVKFDMRELKGSFYISVTYSSNTSLSDCPYEIYVRKQVREDYFYRINTLVSDWESKSNITVTSPSYTDGIYFLTFKISNKADSDLKNILGIKEIKIVHKRDGIYPATQMSASTIYTSAGRNFTLSDGVTLIPSNVNETDFTYSLDSPIAYKRDYRTYLLMGHGNYTAKCQGKYASCDIPIVSNQSYGDSQLVLICKMNSSSNIAITSVEGATDWWETVNDRIFIATATVFPTRFKLGDNFNAQYLESVDYLHTKNLTDMNWMFYACDNLESIHFVGDASKVTNLNYTFGSCSKLTSLDLNSWDTSCVSNMSSTFNSCRALSSLDISQWNTSVVNDMSDMFNYCGSLTSLDLSSWDFSNVTNTSYMFGDCTNLYDLYINNYNDSWNISNMCGMFYYCSCLSSIDLSYWYTYNLQDTSYMFYGCNNLYELYLNNFDMTQVWSTDEMFGDCSSLQVLHLDYCNYETVEKIITSSNFPAWNSGTIYCSYDVYSSLTPPGSWTFEPVW